MEFVQSAPGRTGATSCRVASFGLGLDSAPVIAHDYAASVVFTVRNTKGYICGSGDQNVSDSV